jgi:probable addiction module antidote protein
MTKSKTTRPFTAADLKIKPFDAADYLTSPEMITGFLKEAMATGEPAAIQKALGAAARAKGMTKVARATGLSRENLYRSLSGAQAVNFDTILRVIDALALNWNSSRKNPKPPKRPPERPSCDHGDEPRLFRVLGAAWRPCGTFSTPFTISAIVELLSGRRVLGGGLVPSQQSSRGSNRSDRSARTVGKGQSPAYRCSR